MAERNSIARLCTCGTTDHVTYSCKHCVCTACAGFVREPGDQQTVSKAHCPDCSSWINNIAKDLACLGPSSSMWQPLQHLISTEDEQLTAQRHRGGQQQLQKQSPSRYSYWAAEATTQKSHLPLLLTKWSVNGHHQDETGLDQSSHSTTQFQLHTSHTQQTQAEMQQQQQYGYSNTGLSSGSSTMSSFDFQVKQAPTIPYSKHQALGPIGKRPPSANQQSLSVLVGQQTNTVGPIGQRFPNPASQQNVKPLSPQTSVAPVGENQSYPLSHPQQSQPHSSDFHPPNPLGSDSYNFVPSKSQCVTLQENITQHHTPVAPIGQRFPSRENQQNIQQVILQTSAAPGCDPISHLKQIQPHSIDFQPPNPQCTDSSNFGSSKPHCLASEENGSAMFIDSFFSKPFLGGNADVRPRPIYSGRGQYTSGRQSNRGGRHPAGNGHSNGIEGFVSSTDKYHFDPHGHLERHLTESPPVDRPPSIDPFTDSSSSQESFPRSRLNSTSSSDGMPMFSSSPSSNGVLHSPTPTISRASSSDTLTGHSFYETQGQPRFKQHSQGRYQNHEQHLHNQQQSNHWNLANYPYTYRGGYRGGYRGRGSYRHINQNGYGSRGHPFDFRRGVEDNEKGLPPLPVKMKFSPEVQLCQQHNLPVLMNCKPCVMGVCYLCYSPGASHEHHDRLYLEKEIKKQKDYMLQMHRGMASILIRMSTLKESISSDLTAFKKAKVTERERIHDFFRVCKEELEKQEQKMSDQLESVVAKKCELAVMHQKELIEKLPWVQKMQEELESFMVNDDGIANSHQLVEKLRRNWESLRDLSQRHVTPELKFVSDNIAVSGLHKACSISSGCYPHSCELRGRSTSHAVVGKAEELSIALIDYQGKQITVKASGLIEVTITLPSGRTKDLGVHYVGEGRYTVRFLPDSVGIYLIEVKVSGLPIKGSPFTVEAYVPPPYHRGIQQPVYRYEDTNLPKESQLFKSWGSAVSKTRQRMYVADRDNHTIWAFRFEKGSCVNGRPSVPVPDFSFGKFGGGEGEFNKPTGVDVHDGLGRVAVVDKDNHRMQIFDLDGNFLFQFGRPPADETEMEKGGVLCYPWDVSFRDDGSMAVTNSRMSRVQVFSPDGTFSRMYPPEERPNNVFQCPRGVCWDREGYLYVTEFERGTLVVIRNDLRTHRIYHCSVDMDIAGEKTRNFHRPQGVTVDTDGHVLVCDSRNMRVLRFEPEEFVDVKKQNLPGQYPAQGMPNGIDQNTYILRPVTIYEPVYFSKVEKILSVCLSPMGDIITIHGVQRKEWLSAELMAQKNEKIRKSKELAQKTINGTTSEARNDVSCTVPQGEHEVEKNHILIFRP